MQKNRLQRFYEETYRQTSFGEFDCYERNRLLRKIYPKQQERKRLLDIAAGDGLTSIFFREQNYEVIALEWNSDFIKKLEQENIHSLQHDVEKIPYPFSENTFDEIFWGDNIEHLFFPLDVAKELERILKPGGRLVISTPNHGWIINRLYYLAFGIPRRTEGQKLPPWLWQHIRYFNKSTLAAFLFEAGFSNAPTFKGTDRRKSFEWLAVFWPAFFGSLLLAEIKK